MNVLIFKVLKFNYWIKLKEKLQCFLLRILKLIQREC